MTFYEAYKTAITMFALKENDEKVKKITEAGLNAALRLIASTYGKTKSLLFTPLKNVPYTLPNDFLFLQLLMQDANILSENDYMIKSDFILITDPDIADTELSLIYTYTPALLTIKDNSNTELPVNSLYEHAVINYACYHIAMQVGRMDIADKFLNDFTLSTGIGKEDRNARSSKKS